MLLPRLNQLRKEEKCCDTILVSKDGEEFKVHWLVLVSKGVWWARRDEERAEGDIRVILPDIQTSDVRRFVDEIYGGDVNVEPINPLTILVSRTQGVLTTYSVSPLHPEPSCHLPQPSCPCPHPSNLVMEQFYEKHNLTKDHQ